MGCSNGCSVSMYDRMIDYDQKERFLCQYLLKYDMALVIKSTDQRQALVREFGRVSESMRLRENSVTSKKYDEMIMEVVRLLMLIIRACETESKLETEKRWCN